VTCYMSMLASDQGTGSSVEIWQDCLKSSVLSFRLNVARKILSWKYRIMFLMNPTLISNLTFGYTEIAYVCRFCARRLLRGSIWFSCFSFDH